MLKSDLLRAALIEKNQWCKANPDRLTVWAEKGHLEISGSDLSYMYVYKINVLAQEYPGSVDDLTIPLLAWLSQNQPDLLLNPDKNKQIAFDADPLSDTTADVLFTVPVWERVIVTQEGGEVKVAHLAEPAPRSFGNDWVAVFEGSLSQGGQ